MRAGVAPEGLFRKWEPVSLTLDDGEIAGYRAGAPGATPILFCHANGFCASAYRQLLTAVGDGCDILAIDLRGHGRTGLPAAPEGHRDWHIYAEDIGKALALARSDLGMTGDFVLSGHSLGAVGAVLAAARGGDAGIAGLALFEPVLPPLAFRVFARSPVWPLVAPNVPLMRNARQRRADWASREAAAERYRRKSIFAGLADGVLDDYLRDGLRETGEGGLTLACAPAWESANFMAQGHKAIPALKRIDAPIAVLAADRGSTVSPGGERALRSVGARLERVAGASHLLPLERPDAGACFLRDFAAAKSAQSW